MIGVARAEAASLGLELRAPPVPLEDCNRSIIESALLAPTTGFKGVDKYIGLAAKAGALTYALAKSQACVDGNKRVAFLLLSEFLSLNGCDLRVTTEEGVEMILKTANSTPANRDMTTLELAAWFERHIAGCAD